MTIRLYPIPGLNRTLTVILYALLLLKTVIVICWFEGIKPPPADHLLTVLLTGFLLFPLTKGLILTLMLHGWIKRRNKRLTAETQRARRSTSEITDFADDTDLK